MNQSELFLFFIVILVYFLTITTLQDSKNIPFLYLKLNLLVCIYRYQI